MSAERLCEPLSYRSVQDMLADETELTERFGGYYGEMDRAALVVAVIEAVTER